MVLRERRRRRWRGAADSQRETCRYYCGQRDKRLWLYGCTLGMFGIAWLADAFSIPYLLHAFKANQSGDFEMKDVFGGGGSESHGHGHASAVPHAYLPFDDANDERTHVSAQEQQAASELAHSWNAVIAKAQHRQPNASATITTATPPTREGDAENRAAEDCGKASK